MAKIVKRKRRRLSFHGFAIVLFSLSLVAWLASSLLVNTMNAKLTMKIQTMNDTKYVLVEFNIRTSYSQIFEAMQKIENARFRPIIAHVERYRCLFKHIERIEELIRMEVLLQMNISSVYGGILDENARWCKKLVREGHISFFGTDAHDMEERAPYINDYVAWIEKKCGLDYLEKTFRDNPQKMIENKYIFD